MVNLLLAVIYLSFISLGLPDGLLGSGWPTMYIELGVPMSFAGILTILISGGTIISSLMSDWLTYRLGAGKVTAISVAVTALALLGFSVTRNFWVLCLIAIPYGMGAGSVDACLNNYVALHYSSRHMSWLHCMWGVGASIGPYAMGLVLSGDGHWSQGYQLMGILQVVLTAVLLISLPLWKNRAAQAEAGEEAKPVPITQVVKIPGAFEVMVAFFGYCALEQTAALWASSYLALYKGVPAETAAFFGSMFFIGITIGRALNGFLTEKFTDNQLIWAGFGIIALGILAMMLPMGSTVSLIGFILIGLGCAPIYPCIIHSTPEHFGPEKSQALIGVQMACAYTGILVMPPLFGLIANHISLALLPGYLLVILALMAVMHKRMLRIVAK